MKRFLSGGLGFLLAIALALSPRAVGAQNPSPAQEIPHASPVVTRSQLILRDDTPVLLAAKWTVSSNTAHVGDIVEFMVLEAVTVDGLVVIPKLAGAFGKVTDVRRARSLNRDGRLTVIVESVQLATGEMAALRAIEARHGKGAAGTLGVNLFGLGAAYAFFLIPGLEILAQNGRDKELLAGADVTAFVNGAVVMDREKLHQELAPLAIESNPSEAQVELDGNVAGVTPYSASLPVGKHVIIIKKTGFEPVRMELRGPFGDLTLTAQMEAQPKP